MPCACDNVSRQLGLSATHSCSQHANFMWLTYERCLVLHSKGLRRFYKVSASRRTLLSSLELRLLCCLGCLVDRSWLRSFFTFVNGGRTAARVFFFIFPLALIESVCLLAIFGCVHWFGGWTRTTRLCRLCVYVSVFSTFALTTEQLCRLLLFNRFNFLFDF